MIDFQQLLFLMALPAGGLALGLWAIYISRPTPQQAHAAIGEHEAREEELLRQTRAQLATLEATLERANALVEAAQERPVRVVVRSNNIAPSRAGRRWSPRAHRIPAE